MQSQIEFIESEKKIFDEKLQIDLNPTEKEYEIAVKNLRLCNMNLWEDYECNTCK